MIGILATVASFAVGKALSRWIPNSIAGKSKDTLLRENRLVIRFANTSTLVGLGTGFLVHQAMRLANNDWRALGLGLGLAFAAPLVVLYVAALWRRVQMREVVTAYALNQRLPAAVLYAMAMMGTLMLVISIATLIKE